MRSFILSNVWFVVESSLSGLEIRICLKFFSSNCSGFWLNLKKKPEKLQYGICFLKMLRKMLFVCYLTSFLNSFSSFLKCLASLTICSSRVNLSERPSNSLKMAFDNFACISVYFSSLTVSDVWTDSANEFFARAKIKKNIILVLRTWWIARN